MVDDKEAMVDEKETSPAEAGNEREQDEASVINGNAGDETRFSPHTSTLIELVRKNRCLYDKGDASYHNNLLKVDIWKSIAESIGLPDAKAVSARWKNLRGKYNKCRKRIAAIGQDTERLRSFEQNKWVYYDEMAWLEPHMEVDIEQLQDSEMRGGGSIMDSLMEFAMKEVEDQKLSDDDSSSNQQDGWNQPDMQYINGDQSRVIVSSSNPNKRLRLQQRKAYEGFSQFMKTISNQSNGQDLLHAQPITQQFSEEELYGLSVGKRLSKLTPQKRALARVKFEQVFYELLDSPEGSDQ